MAIAFTIIKIFLNSIHDPSGEEEVVPAGISSDSQSNPDVKGTSGKSVSQR